MGRQICEVYFSDSAPPKYAIHCTTAGATFSPLYSDKAKAETARQKFENGDWSEEKNNHPKTSKSFRVAKIDLRYGVIEFMLASDDHLIVSHEYDTGYYIQKIDNQIHISEDVRLGIGRDYLAPICNHDLILDNSGRVKFYPGLNLSDYYQSEVAICSACCEKLS